VRVVPIAQKREHQDRPVHTGQVHEAHNHALAVLFLDLDRFKLVNDTFGHPVGDRLLQSVARVLERCVRSLDLNHDG